MFVKLSATGANTYLSCQRKYWHQRLDKTCHDSDSRQGNGLVFGRVIAQLQEEFSPDPIKLMTATRIKEAFAAEGLSINDAARGMAVLRKYYGTFAQGVVTKVEQWLEHPTLVGKLDKLMKFCDRTFIIEDKVFSDINPALRDTLKTDSQLCLYASCAEQFEADAIMFRVISKPKERRKKEESWEEYARRCTCEALEITFEFSELDIKGCLDKFESLQAEISEKGMEKARYMCNTKNCQSYGYACEWFSQCHGKTHTESIGDW
jgi:hypothetical protein